MVDVITGLERGGWHFSEGRIRYLVDPEFFDWDQADPSDRLSVILALENASQRHGCGFQMAWGTAGQEASFLLLESGSTLSISPFAELAFRNDVGNFLDHDWYLSKALPTLFDLGVTGYNFQDIQD
ncbi:hypothetical protein [Streptomyces sp. NPDC057682]|uniref:hypothetical protein n=1 Tax=Streptomyces sp. NPDC057682 TaxID=3346210 RepID=UPI0036895398